MKKSISKILKPGIICALLSSNLIFTAPAWALWVEIQAALAKGDMQTVIKEASPAAHSGDVNAQVLLGKIYASEESNTYDYKKSIFWYEKAANSGDKTAQYHMGEIMEGGQGVKADLKTAIAWYQKSSAQGYAPAQFRLGLIYYNGEGVTVDYKMAYELFKDSSEANEGKAQQYLALMLGRGEGTAKDLGEAYKWATIYDWKMPDESMSIKAQLAKEMRASQIKESVVRAEAWLAAYKSKNAKQ